jgi:hypothetical protein
MYHELTYKGPWMATLSPNVADEKTEQFMRDYFNSLNEKDRRRFAAVEARLFGHGGIVYVASVLRCSRRTIERGMKELNELPHDPAGDKIRRPGAGQKKMSEWSEAEDHLISLLDVRTAGDPDDEDIIFTDLSPATLADRMAALGTPVCRDTIRDWMDENNLRLRKISKRLAGGESTDRDAQFARGSITGPPSVT